MKLLQVNYRRDLGQDDRAQSEHLLEAAEKISGLPGLRWKIWIFDDARHSAGGIYLFDTEENARSWGEQIPGSLGRLPGFGDIEMTYFDVDERLTAVTRGPLGTVEQV